jgi:small subunit ribosomal protein S4
VARALGIDLPGLTVKKIERRPYPPGQHGQARKRKLSEYGLRLREKQKLRFHYGLSERQLRGLVLEAMTSRAATGAQLAELVERRLDSVLFRAGFAPTIPSARQRVTHGHVQVNGRRVDIPSYRVRRGDVVALRAGSPFYEEREVESAAKELVRPPWLTVDRATASASVLELPDEGSIPFPIELRLVVEFYSR